MNLNNQTVLVTGGGSGIGLGIARALAEEGCKVAITGRREPRLQEAVSSIQSEHPVLYKTCDVANREQVKELFDWLNEQNLLPLDILANSAGMNISKRMLSNVDPEEFDRVLSVNTTGLFNVIHAAIPGMREKKSGLIVNISSIAGRRALLLAGLPYCASKYAATAIGNFVNLEEAENGIRVTNIYPGEANTPILDDRPTPPPPEKREKMIHPEDIGACVATIAKLPSRCVVSDLVIVPTYQVHA